PREGRAAVGGFLEGGVRETEHHVASVGGRGPVLRLDRRPQTFTRREQLHDPLLAAEGRQQVEPREPEALRRAGRRGAREARGPGGTREVAGREGRVLA